MLLDELDHPIVLAPLSGGPSTPELCSSVCDAGGLGFLAAGYATAETVQRQIAEVRERTSRPFGVNLFVPTAAEVDPASLTPYLERLTPEARRYAVEVGEPRHDDDHWQAKLAVIQEAAPAAVSFTFGCPSAELLRAVRLRGCEVWVTITSQAEALEAARAGADVLIVQGAEAGGHRGGFADRADVEPLGLLPLLRLVASSTDLPLVAAGGIADGASVAAVLCAGARAAQLGTAFLRVAEAGTNSAHREAVANDRPTALTRAFTGRLARGIVNRFMESHGDAPIAYPEIHNATAPIRAAARARSDADGFNLWAGQAHVLARELPAAELVRLISAEARNALAAAAAVTV